MAPASYARPGWPAIPESTPAVGVTARLSPHSIWFVNSWTAKMLTKRRAVDFCHVATAICPGTTRPLSLQLPARSADSCARDIEVRWAATRLTAGPLNGEEHHHGN